MSTSRLAVLRLDKPCQLPWDELTPVNATGTVRHCSQCELNVTNLSAMTEDEAEAFLARAGGGRTCVSFVRDRGAGVVTLDYQQNTASRYRWPITAAAVVALAAGGAAAYRAASVAPAVIAAPFVGSTQMMGEIAPPAPMAYSPFNPPATSSAACATQQRLLATQLKSDPSLQPILAALPAEMKIIDVQYNVFPAGFSSQYGRCIVIGEPATDSAAAPDASDIHAVIWILPKDNAIIADLTQAGETHPLRFAGSSQQGDVLIWTDDAALERSLVAGLLSSSERTSLQNTNWKSLLND